MNQNDLFTSVENETMLTLTPCQSLALRQMIDAMREDDSIYAACPEVVRKALCDFMLPPYTTAEAQIRALINANSEGLILLEKFGARIRDLEKRLQSRNG